MSGELELLKEAAARATKAVAEHADSPKSECSCDCEACKSCESKEESKEEESTDMDSEKY